MSSNAHASDPVSPRLMGAGLATVGLVVLMASGAPNWQSLGIAVVCLFGFLISLLIPRPRPAAEAEPVVPTEIAAEESSSDPAMPAAGADPRMQPRKPPESHRAIRANVRDRQVIRG